MVNNDYWDGIRRRGRVDVENSIRCLELGSGTDKQMTRDTETEIEARQHESRDRV